MHARRRFPVARHDGRARPMTDRVTDLARLRSDYRRASLDADRLDPDPLVQLAAWLDDAIRAEAPEPTAMTIATADAQGRPAARIVLLKGIDARGCVFFTHYDSAKGRDLAANPRAALVWFWAPLERQVRVEGGVEVVDAAESDAYFASRPRGSRVSAVASPQSREVPDRAWLEARIAEVERAHPGDDVPRPPRWGGYRVVPAAVEFWQGRPSRLHDRIRYTRHGDTWSLARLAP
jgi:pyridoxamine 5'-phosphate oxidase